MNSLHIFMNIAWMLDQERDIEFHNSRVGLLDEVVQVYRPTDKLASELANRKLVNLIHTMSISIDLYTVTFSSPKTIGQMQREVEMVKDQDYQGVVFCYWETTLWLFKGSAASQVKQAFQQLFY